MDIDLNFTALTGSTDIFIQIINLTDNTVVFAGTFTGITTLGAQTVRLIRGDPSNPYTWSSGDALSVRVFRNMGGTFTYYVNGLRWSMSGGGFNRIGANTQFIEHTDTPSTYASQAGNYVTVNSTEDGLQFTAVTPGGGGGAVTADEQRALNAISVQAGSTDNLIQEIDMLAGFRIIGDLGRNRTITSAGTELFNLPTGAQGDPSISVGGSNDNVTAISFSGTVALNTQVEFNIGDTAILEVVGAPRYASGNANAINPLPAGAYQVVITGVGGTSSGTVPVNTVTANFTVDPDQIFPIAEGLVSPNTYNFPVGGFSGGFSSTYRYDTNAAGNNGIFTVSLPQTATETSQQTLHVRTPSNNEFLVTDTEIEFRDSNAVLGFRFDITTGDLDVAGEVRANSSFPDPTP